MTGLCFGRFFARNDDKSAGKWHLDSFPAADYVAAQCPEVLLFIVADLDVPLGIIAQQGERTLTRPRARGFLKNELTILYFVRDDFTVCNRINGRPRNNGAPFRVSCLFRVRGIGGGIQDGTGKNHNRPHAAYLCGAGSRQGAGEPL